jgi:uncharacterized protein (TIGR03435 family)
MKTPIQTFIAWALAMAYPICMVCSSESQLRTEPKPSFEVASIKPTSSKDSFINLRKGSGRFIAQNTTVKQLILWAYDIQNYQVSNAPGWIGKDRYDIEAKTANPKESNDHINLMLQSLLEERFKLKIHCEKREIPTYSLVIAKGGHKLQSVEKENRGTFSGGISPDGKTSISDASAQSNPFKNTPGLANINMLGGSDIRHFADILSNILPRKVVDKTGLTGRFEISLEWMPDTKPPNVVATSERATTAPEITGPSIFTALEEQLGLKLESDRDQGEFFVIDSVDKPSEN